MKVELISCGPAVNESERRAFERLKTGLIAEQGDGEWLLLTNLAFSTSHRRQSDEIDMVAIGPHGVRVIEVKHWSAAWVKRNPDLVEREAERVANKARKVGTTLRQVIPELGRVDGVFLVTQDAAKVKPLEGQEVRGVRFHTLRAWKGALGLGEPGYLTPSQVKRLGKVLYPKASVAIDGALRRLADYGNLELQTPADERFHRMYKGTHSTRRDSVLLHLYDLCMTCRQPISRTQRKGRGGSLTRCTGCNFALGHRALSIHFKQRRGTRARWGSSRLQTRRPLALRSAPPTALGMRRRDWPLLGKP